MVTLKPWNGVEVSPIGSYFSLKSHLRLSHLVTLKHLKWPKLTNRPICSHCSKLRMFNEICCEASFGIIFFDRQDKAHLDQGNGVQWCKISFVISLSVETNNIIMQYIILSCILCISCIHHVYHVYYHVSSMILSCNTCHG